MDWGLSLRHHSLQSIAAQSLALRRQQIAAGEEIIAVHVSDFRARYGQPGAAAKYPSVSGGLD